MARKFNLQPWRQVRRETKKKQFIIITAVLVCLVIAGCLAERWYQQRIVTQQQSAIALLKEDIAKFNHAKAEVERLVELNKEVNRQIEVIQQLEKQRGLAVKILDFFATQTPDNVFLTYLQFKDGKVTLKGVVENGEEVSEFYRILSSFEYFSIPDVGRIQSAKSTGTYTVAEGSEVKSFEVVIPIKVDEELL